MTAYTLTTHETLVGQPFTLLEASSGASDTLTISAEGALEQTSAGISALLMQTGTQLFNRGTITGTTTGIAMVGGASISNYATGLIQAADAAIDCQTVGANIFNEFGGRIQGGVTGIRIAKADARIENYGTISGQVAVHVLESATPGGRVTLINTGSLISTVTTAGAYAVRLNQAEVSEFENRGTVTGAVHVFAHRAAYIYNHGTINGDVYLHTQNAGGTNAYQAFHGGWVTGTIYTGDNNSLLSGGTRADRFVSGAGHDTIFGGDGNDVIDGGRGFNVLGGGLGADEFISKGTVDQFVYKSASESVRFGEDTIRGFDLLDVIDLREVAGTGTRSFIGTHAFFGRGNFEVRVDEGGGVHYVSVDVNGDSFRDMLIIVFGSHDPMTAGDFLL